MGQTASTKNTYNGPIFVADIDETLCMGPFYMCGAMMPRDNETASIVSGAL